MEDIGIQEEDDTHCFGSLDAESRSMATQDIFYFWSSLEKNEDRAASAHGNLRRACRPIVVSNEHGGNLLA